MKNRTDTQPPPPASPGQAPPADPGMIPLTVPEIKRTLAALTARPRPAGHVIHWDEWTRRHQARARWFHQRVTGPSDLHGAAVHEEFRAGDEAALVGSEEEGRVRDVLRGADPAERDPGDQELWTAPSFLEAVTSGKVGTRDFKEAAPRRAAGTCGGDGLRAACRVG